MKIQHYKYLLLLLSLFAVISCTSTKETTKEEVKLEKPANLLQGSNIDTSLIKSTARNYVILGSNYQMMNRHAEAIIEFQQAVRLDTIASIYYAIAKSYKELSKFDLALENVNTSLTLDPDFLPAWDLLVELHVMNYDLKKAILTVEQLLKKSDSRERRVMLARLYEFESLDKAIDIYEKLLLEAMDYSLLQRLTYLYRQNQQNEEFIKGLNQLFENDNQDPAIIYDLLEYYADNKDYENIKRIIGGIDKSYSLTDLSYIYYTIANDYISKDNEVSKVYIEDLLSKIDSRFYFDWVLNVSAGELALKIGEKQIADTFFQRGLKLADTLYAVPMHIAYSYFYNKYYRESADIIERYKSVFPDSLPMYFIAADAYYQLDDLNASIENMNQVLAIDSNNVAAVSNLSSYYDKIGRKADAYATFEKGLRLDRGNALLNNNFAFSLAEANEELERALKMSNIAISAEPTNAAFLDTYGWVMFKLGNYEKAEEYILKALSILEAGELYDHLGDVYQATGKTENALANWRKALMLEPNREHLKSKIEKYSTNK